VATASGPPASTRLAAPAPPASTRRRLGVALGIEIGLAIVAAAALALVLLGWSGALPVLVGATLVLGLVQVAVLLRAREEAASGVPLAAPATSPLTGVDQPEVAQELRAFLAAGPSDEVGTLMREFTRILEVLQGQASQVQDYAGRFEAINEELRNANLRLRELSLTDELTEIGNRRNFDVRMREEINRSSRFGHAFSLLLLDIDQFKRFNDEFGHPQGDAVLRGLGALMRSMSREGDVPCRIGGEEFAFILPETGKADAMAFAERMRRGVEATIMSPDGQRSITVSLGLAAFPEDGKSPEDLIRAADEALYESKHAGRNRVTAYLRK
jgi:diguanylate cyclase (GGDEF)-like protein